MLLPRVQKRACQNSQLTIGGTDKLYTLPAHIVQQTNEALVETFRLPL